MPFISKKHLKELEDAYQIYHRTLTAHRWWGEYDNILQPMWEYIYQNDKIGFNNNVETAKQHFKLNLMEYVNHCMITAVDNTPVESTKKYNHGCRTAEEVLLSAYRELDDSRAWHARCIIKDYYNSLKIEEMVNNILDKVSKK